MRTSGLTPLAAFITLHHYNNKLGESLIHQASVMGGGHPYKFLPTGAVGSI